MVVRKSITIAQKASLRRHKDLYPLLTHPELREWFFNKYNHQLTKSTTSEILSSRYNHLDAPSIKRPKIKRQRQEHWPDLENALYTWLKHAETRIPISLEVIQEKAKYFWENIDMYNGKPMPRFSNGWLAGFQARKGVKNRELHGEDGSVEDKALMEMIAVRQALGAYSPRDIFNCDESALYWKRVPDRSVTTRSLPGRKKEKARITAHFTCNSDGSERLPIWFIGTAKKPRCFTAAK